VISGFHHNANEVFTLLEYCTTLTAN